MTIEAVLNSTVMLGTILICIVIGRLRDTVKTIHKARFEWNYGQDSVVAKPLVMLTPDGNQCPG